MGIGIQMDPNKVPIGRQALSAIWTPSRPRYPWFGTIPGAERTKLAFVGGARFTLEQGASLIALGMDVPTAKSMMVKRQALGDEIYRSPYDLPEVFEFECPLTGKKTPAGKLQVITPAGLLANVYPDGWALRPYRTPAIYSMGHQR